MENAHLHHAASTVIVHLMKGVIYGDTHPSQWQDLLSQQNVIRDYFATIRLEVILDESEGYAFLRQIPEIEGEEHGIPRLIQRRPLSFPVSLLCVLLRRKLAEQDASGGETRLILGREQIRELLRVFFKDTSNEVRLVQQIDGHLNRLVDYGLLRVLNGDEERFEVRRVLKALVDAEWLGEMSEKLERYAKHARDTF
jgi:hypothetical protein